LRNLGVFVVTDNYGTQQSGEFGITPAEEGILNNMRDDFCGRAGLMVEGYTDTMVLIWCMG